MIIEELITGFFNKLTQFIQAVPLMPALEQSLYFVDVVASIWAYLDSFVIMSNMATIVGVIVFVDNVGLFYRLFRWIWEALPFN